MIEHNIVKAAIVSKDAHYKITLHLDRKSLSEYGSAILDIITDYYNNDPDVSEVDEKSLLHRIDKKYPNKKSDFEYYLNQLPISVSVENVLEDIVLQKQTDLGLKIGSVAIEEPTSDKLGRLMEEWLSASDVADEQRVYHETPIEELIEKVSGENLIPIYPSALNDKLGGGLPRQSQVLIAARPDVGKSTTAMNIAGAACQKGYKVLYCGNEEAAAIMNLRMVSRLTNKTKPEILEDAHGTYEEAIASGYSNFYFVDLHPGSIAEIRHHVERIRPDMVVIDQIRLIRVNKKEGLTSNLEAAAIGMRGLAKEFFFVSVLVTQAGESAARKLIIDMEDIADSKTGIQGQLDLMIGVGQNDDYKQNNRVMLSFPKYKHGNIAPFSCVINYPLNKLLTRK